MVMKVNMSWYDRRLTYKNLKSDIYRNLISPDERDQIWKPIYGFLKIFTFKLWILTVKFKSNCLTFLAFENAVTGTIVEDDVTMNYITNYGLPKSFDDTRLQ